MSNEDWGFNENATLGQWVATSIDHDTAPITPQTNSVLQSELSSEIATRGIFNWLRPDGYPPSEKAIFEHSWFDVGDSSEESVSSADDPPIMEQSSIKAWLNDVDFY